MSDVWAASLRLDSSLTIIAYLVVYRTVNLVRSDLSLARDSCHSGLAYSSSTFLEKPEGSSEPISSSTSSDTALSIECRRASSD